jgi:hypothetical protein
MSIEIATVVGLLASVAVLLFGDRLALRGAALLGALKKNSIRKCGLLITHLEPFCGVDRFTAHRAS